MKANLSVLQKISFTWDELLPFGLNWSQRCLTLIHTIHDIKRSVFIIQWTIFRERTSEDEGCGFLFLVTAKDFAERNAGFTVVGRIVI